jgi:hypothetical protein
MTNLTSKSKSALDRVVRAQVAYSNAKETFEQELKQELAQKLESFVTERNVAVKMADIAGVPRTQIGRALGTTNYRTVQDILEDSVALVQSFQDDERKWSAAKTEQGWQVSIQGLGAGAVTGSAVVAVDNGELVFVDGDPFVVPQAYRHDIAQQIIEHIQ